MKIAVEQQGIQCVVVVKTKNEAMKQWELTKYKTAELVDELLTRKDLTTDQTSRLDHHAHTLECMYSSPYMTDYDYEAQIKEEMESL